MSIDMSKSIEVDESVEASATQSTEMEEDDSLLMSGTILSFKSFVLTSSRPLLRAKSPLSSASHLRIHTFVAGCRPVTTFITFQSISVNDAPSILPHVPCPMS